MRSLLFLMLLSVNCFAESLMCSRPKGLVRPAAVMEDDSLVAFSQLHSNATGEGMLGMMVAVGDVQIDPEMVQSEIESVVPKTAGGYFGVMLNKYNIQVDIAAGHSVVAYRYTFPESKEGHVLMDLSRSLPFFQGGEIFQRDDKTYEGVATYSIGGRKTPIYFSFQYSKPFRQRGVWKGDEVLEGRNRIEANEKTELGAYVYFWTHEDETILMKVGVSSDSIDDARAKLAEEFPGWDFDQFRKESELAWAK